MTLEHVSGVLAVDDPVDSAAGDFARCTPVLWQHAGHPDVLARLAQAIGVAPLLFRPQALPRHPQFHGLLLLAQRRLDGPELDQDVLPLAAGTSPGRDVVPLLLLILELTRPGDDVERLGIGLPVPGGQLQHRWLIRLVCAAGGTL